jgi:hypothetical protein
MSTSVLPSSGLLGSRQGEELDRDWAPIRERPHAQAVQAKHGACREGRPNTVNAFDLERAALHNHDRVAPICRFNRHLRVRGDRHVANDELPTNRGTAGRAWRLTAHERDDGSPKPANSSGLTKLVISVIVPLSTVSRSRASGRYASAPGART